MENQPVQRPASVHTRITRREATELGPLSTRSPLQSTTNDAVRNQRSEGNLSGRHDLIEALSLNGVRKFWRQHVAITVPHDACRDHLALERTFLAYLRTSLGLAVMGVTIDQLFRLKHSATPDEVLGFFVVGEPLAAIFIGGGLLILLFGAWRFWRQQNALARGKIHASGWEVRGVGGIVATVGIQQRYSATSG